MKNIKLLDNISFILLSISLVYLIKKITFISLIGGFISTLYIIYIIVGSIKHKQKIDDVFYIICFYILYNIIMILRSLSINSLYIACQQITLLIYAYAVYRYIVPNEDFLKFSKNESILYYILLGCLLIIVLSGTLLKVETVISKTILKIFMPMSFFVFCTTKNKKFFIFSSVIVLFIAGERTEAIIFGFIYIIDMLINEQNIEKIKKKLFYIINIFCVGWPYFYVWLSKTEIGNILNKLIRYYTGENLFSGRHRLWSIILNAIEDHKMFGLNYDNNVFQNHNISMSTHNLYLWLTLNGGYIMLLLFIALTYYIYRQYDMIDDFKMRKNATIYFIALLMLTSQELILMTNNFVISIYMWLVIMLPLCFRNREIKKE